jgi:2,4-dienoyl-CoA reductase (NADPH2)
MIGETHLYTTEIGGELVLFDTGPFTPEAVDFLHRNVDLKRLRHLIITHCHVDHYGLADYIGANFGAEIYLPRKDALKFRHHEQRLAGIEVILAEYGFDPRFARSVRESAARNKLFPPFPRRFRVVEDAIQELSRLGVGCVSCPGHSQSDLVYLCEGKAITGDVLLRGIFQAPLLDLDLETLSCRFRNYDAYCRSLLELGRLRGFQILPGHCEYVDSLEGTILFYVTKLLERARRVRELSKLPVSMVVRTLLEGTEADPFVHYLKASEIIFMRDFLADPVPAAA